MRRVVLLFSGGIDSTTLAYDLLSVGVELEALFIDYGQRTAVGERRSARYLAGIAGFSLTELCIPLPEDLTSGALFGLGAPRDWKTPRVSFLPQRNLLLLTYAAMFAQRRGIPEVAIGLINGGSEFPDSTESFCKQAFQVLRLCYPDLQVLAPYVSWTKEQVIARAVTLGVPIEATFSCHFLPDRHCGSCPACVERFRGYSK